MLYITENYRITFESFLFPRNRIESKINTSINKKVFLFKKNGMFHIIENYMWLSCTTTDIGSIYVYLVVAAGADHVRAGTPPTNEKLLSGNSCPPHQFIVFNLIAFIARTYLSSSISKTGMRRSSMNTAPLGGELWLSVAVYAVQSILISVK